MLRGEKVTLAVLVATIASLLIIPSCTHYRKYKTAESIAEMYIGDKTPPLTTEERSRGYAEMGRPTNKNLEKYITQHTDNL